MTPEKMEKAFMTLSAAVLVVFLGALFYASAVMGITLPGRAGEIDPALVRTTAPFDNPGVRQISDNEYEVVMLGAAWYFQPNEIRVPAGAEVTFKMTAVDVIHGVEVERTRINVMLIPGQISEYTYTFDEPGEHLIICHEYCGAAHHTMFGKVIVE